MEIIFELLIIIVQFVFELVLQLFFEGLVEVGAQKFSSKKREPMNPWLALIGYVFLGAIIGGISVWIWPTSFIASQPLRVVNLLVTPLLAGGVMALIGAWRAKRGDPVLYIDRFAYGLVFAFSMALVRFFFTMPA
jgi:hypothetical protein